MRTQTALALKNNKANRLQDINLSLSIYSDKSPKLAARTCPWVAWWHLSSCWQHFNGTPQSDRRGSSEGGCGAAEPGDVLRSRTLQRRYQPEKGNGAKADKWHNVLRYKLVQCIFINDQAGHLWTKATEMKTSHGNFGSSTVPWFELSLAFSRVSISNSPWPLNKNQSINAPTSHTHTHQWKCNDCWVLLSS